MTGLRGSAQRVERGADEDFDAVYRAEVPWLIRFFRRQVRDRQDAQSLAQETMLRFFRIGASAGIVTPQAYLRRIAVNLLRDRSKIARRRAADRHVSLDDVELAGPSLQRQLEARDLLRLVEEAMLELRPRTREVFMAVRVDGLSYAEIREQTGLSLKAIEKEMARALAHINRITSED